MGNSAAAGEGDQFEAISLSESPELEVNGRRRSPGQGTCLSFSSACAAPPLPLHSGSAAYLREILACEESFRAAFEPVLRAARCPITGGLDRDAFARAVVRISSYFNPLEPVSLRGPTFGPPYTVEEALGLFRTTLRLLADRLEELERPSQRIRRSTLAAVTGVPGGAAVVGSEDRQPVGPWHSWPGLPLSSKPTPSTGLPPEPVGAISRTCASPRQAPAPSPQAPAPPPQAPALPLVGGGGGSGESLGASLEASRTRVAGLRRALGREEELLRHQAEETRRLEHLQRDLEAEAEAAARRRTLAVAARVARAAAAGAEESRHDGSASQRQHHGQEDSENKAWAPGSGSAGVEGQRLAGEAEKAGFDDAALEGPLSLEDVKYHLRTVTRLRRRVAELEGALDGREEQVAVLSEELRRRTASAR